MTQPYRAGSLAVYDLGAMAAEVNTGVLRFSFAHRATKRDLTRLFTSRLLLAISAAYRDAGAMAVFYLSDADREAMLNHREIVDYRVSLNALRRIKFAYASGKGGAAAYASSLKRGTALYEEAMMSHVPFGELVPGIYEHVRKLGFYRVDRELLKDARELMRCVATV